jgi:hypothetical protein
MHDAVHEDTRGMNAGRRYIAERNDMAGLDDGQGGGHRHHRVEVAGTFAMRQVAPARGYSSRQLRPLIMRVSRPSASSVSAPVGV